MNLREKLITLRNDNKLSQQEFADLLGVSRQTVTRWESGKSAPSSAQISNICRVFQVDANELFNGSPRQSEGSYIEEGKASGDKPAAQNIGGKKLKNSLLALTGVLAVIAAIGLAVTVAYAVKDAQYDSSATVWIVSIPQNTPMILLSVILSVLIVILAGIFIFIARGRKK